jgi:TrmH family RNA methyltransferase
MKESLRWESVAEMVRRVVSRQGRRRSGLYAIEGTRLVERALRAGAPLTAVLAAAQLAATPDPRHHALFDALSLAGVPLVVAPDAVIAELTEGRDLGRVLGLVRLPRPMALAELLAGVADPLPNPLPRGEGVADPLPNPLPRGEGTSTPAPLPPRSPSLFLAAIDITDPGNVGALTRTAHAAGAAALLVAGASDPFHPRATRISRGSIFRLPVVLYETAADLLADLRRCGVSAIATSAAGGTPLPDLPPLSGPLAVLMGNEAEGLPPEVAGAVDIRVTIPMPPGVDSYSVNAAAAIVLYEVGRSRPQPWSRQE